EATVTSITAIAPAAIAAGAADRLAAQCRDRRTAGDIARHIDADRTRAAGDRRATIATRAARAIGATAITAIAAGTCAIVISIKDVANAAAIAAIAAIAAGAALTVTAGTTDRKSVV